MSGLIAIQLEHQSHQAFSSNVSRRCSLPGAFFAAEAAECQLEKACAGRGSERGDLSAAVCRQRIERSELTSANPLADIA